MAQRTSSNRTQRKSQPDKSAGRQIAAVLLFAGALLVFFLSVIEGEAVWFFLHKGVRGLFGVSVFLVPIVMVTVAVLLSREKAVGGAQPKIIFGSLFMVTVSAALQVFFQSIEDAGFFEAVKVAFEDGRVLHGGGAVGVVFGYLPERLFGDTGAKILIVLFAFVFFMLASGTTLIGLFRTMGKPVQKTHESLKTAISDYGERQAALAEQEEALATAQSALKGRKQAGIDVSLDDPKSRIDIEMGDGYRTLEGDLQRANEEVDRRLAELNPEAAAALKAESAGKKPHRARKTASKIDVELDGEPCEGDAPEQEADEVVSSYRFPPLSLLTMPKANKNASSVQELNQNAERLMQTLQDFGVGASISDIVRGPSVTRYELEPSAGVKISKFTGLEKDIALRLAASRVRIEAPIPNKAAVGIEVPNKTRAAVCLRELIDSPEFMTAKSKLTVPLGKDISGNIVVADLAKMPHLLVAGTTGSGKSVCTNSMILSILFRASPEDVRIILIDPKRVEFSAYNGIPHLLVPVVTDPRKAAGALGWAVTEMLRRYQVFAANNAQNLEDYNSLVEKGAELEKMPQILIVIDELADLMMAASKEVEDSIVRLAQMARAAGMHMVIATQRPSADVLPGLVRSNIPSRIGLTVSKATESRIMLDDGGAEQLLGNGDMLFRPIGMNTPLRIQGGFVSNEERKRVIDFLMPDEATEYDHTIINEIEKNAAATGKSASAAATDGDDGADGEADEMLPKAIEVVVEAGEASTSMLQRRLRLGYSRAGRLVDEMERRGIVGPHEGSKPRQVLITRQQWLEMNMMSEE